MHGEVLDAGIHARNSKNGRSAQRTEDKFLLIGWKANAGNQAHGSSSGSSGTDGYWSPCWKMATEHEHSDPWARRERLSNTALLRLALSLPSIPRIVSNRLTAHHAVAMSNTGPGPVARGAAECARTLSRSDRRARDGRGAGPAVINRNDVAGLAVHHRFRAAAREQSVTTQGMPRPWPRRRCSNIAFTGGDGCT